MCGLRVRIPQRYGYLGVLPSVWIAGSNPTAIWISMSPTECVDVSECDRMKQ